MDGTEEFDWRQRTLSPPDRFQVDLRIGRSVSHDFTGVWWTAKVPETNELLAQGFWHAPDDATPFTVADRVRWILTELLEVLVEPF